MNHHISEYVNLIGSLRTEIMRLKHQLVRGARGGQGSGGGDSARTIRPEVRTYDSVILLCETCLYVMCCGDETAASCDRFSLSFRHPCGDALRNRVAIWGRGQNGVGFQGNIISCTWYAGERQLTACGTAHTIYEPVLYSTATTACGGGANSLDSPVL